MIVTKDLDNNIFDHIYPWGEILSYIAWVIRASYHRTIISTQGKAIFVRDMLINLASVVDWLVANAAKQQQVDIYNFRGNTMQVMHNYAIGDQVYMEMTGIYRKLNYIKQGLYIIIEVFTNGTVKFQQVQVNERINKKG